MNLTIDSDFGYDFRPVFLKLDAYEDQNEAFYQVNKGALRETSIVVEERRQALLERKSQRDDLLTFVRLGLQTRNCAAKPTRDLREYSDPERSIQDLGLDAECSMLYTMEQSVLDETKEIDDTLEALDRIDAQIASSDAALEAYHTSAESGIGSMKQELRDANNMIDDLTEQLDLAEDKMALLDTKRNALLANLDELTGDLDNTLQFIDDMYISLDQIGRELGDMKIQNPLAVINPLMTSYYRTHEPTSKIQHFFPSLLAIIMAFSCVLLSSFIIIREKNSRSFLRNAILPLSKTSILMGTILSVVIVGFLQSLIILFIGKFGFNISGLEDTLSLISIILVGCVLFTILGLTIGTLLKTQESALLSGIFMCTILFVFSGAFIPLELMSKTFFTLVRFNPFRLIEVFFKSAMTYKTTVFTGDLIMITVVELVAFGVVSYLAFSHYRKHA
ncbi:MAG: ABC transporter permease [Candidatus Woesearchaeota archaeon]|jgi:ABC-type multidrug transport system permease subunit|nr:ABC transporter permease [Candidatus Woesearchaeota archaeon]MDP7323357.1 ABC transporter permease [Candidatus Woesearchaeota archaeon]MDP7457126.1 ABC transporter permease [Candidatus Woesearchaeota archaeon]